MINLFLIAAFSLMILGILGSLHPGLPGPLLSISGVIIYWWSTNYTTPGPIFFTVMFFTGILAIVLDYLASYYGAERGGASKKTIYMAVIASLVFFLVTGPLGIIIGTAGTVLLREMMLGKEFEEAFNAALMTTLALLGSVAAKVGLTTIILILFVISLIF